MVKVLFVDDDPRAHRTLDLLLADQYAVIPAYTARQGIERAAAERPDVILLDVNLPDMDGIAALRLILGVPFPPPVIMLTGLAAPGVVKDAILAGACDYIVKPYEETALRGALRTAVARRDVRLAAQGRASLDGMVGESPAIEEVRLHIRRYAPSDSPVLVQGESGTGKELAARLIHDVSRRREGPFVALNCGALPESLLETELFGSEKGAFTDAVSRPGCFERANGGTLFLDEIAEMSSGAQTRLLRVLEQRECTRVGGTRAVPLDVRVVSATNRELKGCVAAGSFRSDLYWRLGVLHVRLPALRERGEDIPLLAAHMLALAGLKEVRLDQEARGRLLGHPWPGNIRELRNVMERAALSCEDGIVRARDIAFD
jgi:DNA-binding NtrC family response regulator